MVFDQVYHLFTVIKLFTAGQFGYRKQMSTENSVLDLSDHIMRNFDRGKITVATFLDLSRAFDTLSRSILIRKLRCYDVNGRTLEWFISCFSQQKQFVNMLDVGSPRILLDSGIA